MIAEVERYKGSVEAVTAWQKSDSRGGPVPGSIDQISAVALFSELTQERVSVHLAMMTSKWPPFSRYPCT